LDDDDHLFIYLFIYLFCGRKSPKKATLDSFICCKASDPSFDQFVNYIFKKNYQIIHWFQGFIQNFHDSLNLFFSKYD
jgi:hypothetical protein